MLASSGESGPPCGVLAHGHQPPPTDLSQPGLGIAHPVLLHSSFDISPRSQAECAPFMKFLCAAWLMLVGAGAWCPAATPRAERFWVFGKEHYRLDDWARTAGLNVKWAGKKQIELTSRPHRLVFTADSRRLLLDGVVVWLSDDIVAKNGAGYITPADVNNTLAPLLWPTRHSARNPVWTVCLDPGHGGNDPGKRDGAQQEKKYTMLLAEELGAQLRKEGLTVCFTRTGDKSLRLDERTAIASQRGADLFISLHFNSAGPGGGSVEGVETYCLTPAGAASSNDTGARGNKSGVTGNRNDAKNILLAYKIHQAITRDAASEDRGLKRARFEVLRDATMPAVLIEAGFMTNPGEAGKIYNPAWRRKVAADIVSGVREYRNTVEKQP